MLHAKLSTTAQFVTPLWVHFRPDSVSCLTSNRQTHQVCLSLHLSHLCIARPDRSVPPCAVTRAEIQKRQKDIMKALSDSFGVDKNRFWLLCEENPGLDRPLEGRQDGHASFILHVLQWKVQHSARKPPILIDVCEESVIVVFFCKCHIVIFWDMFMQFKLSIHKNYFSCIEVNPLRTFFELDTDKHPPAG